MQQRQGRPRNSLLPTKVSSYLNVLLKLVLILTGRVLYYLLHWLVLILPAMHCIRREHFVWYLTDVDRIICCFILHFRIFIQNGNVTRSRWSASNLDLRVALKVIAVSLFLSCQHLPWRRISVLKVISKILVTCFYYQRLGEETVTTYVNALGLTRLPGLRIKHGTSLYWSKHPNCDQRGGSSCTL